jgi:hypothetical protein
VHAQVISDKKKFASNVRNMFLDLGLSLRAIEEVFNVGGGPRMALESFGDLVFILSQTEDEYEELYRLLPEPFAYVWETRQEVELKFQQRGIIPPAAGTNTGFFNKLRCMKQLLPHIAGKIELVPMDLRHAA